MALTLTIVSLTVLLGLSLIGAWRGVLPGVLTLLATLVGALLAQLWAPAWSAWLAQRFQLETPPMLLWGVTVLTFLLTVLIVGYGSAALLPQPKVNPAVARPQTQARANLLARGLGAVLGLFEAVLVLGFLLRYSVDLLKSESFNAALRSSPPARLLHDGLGWAFLIPALLVVVALLARMVVSVSRAATARRRAAAIADQAARVAEQPAATPAPAEPKAKT